MALLSPFFQDWYFDAGEVFMEAGDEVQYAYLPCGPSLASFVVVLEDGSSVETALVGREGAVCGIVSQGHLPAFTRVVVQFPGRFLRIAIADLENAKEQSESISNLFARYADCLLAQVFQSVACNAAHSIEQRAAKWLRSAIDRTGDHDVPITQEQLASMLGVGRSYISRVMHSLKMSGVLETRRGKVRILDMERLSTQSCGCNDALRRHFDLVLAGVYPSWIESSMQKAAADDGRPGARMEM